jgi:sirohydrochlorin cobaltochelatase
VNPAALLLGHGSPDPAAHAELGELRALVGQRLGFSVHLGVLEFPAPGLPYLDEAFAALRDRPCVAAQPLILFEGLHGRHDIPAAAVRATARLGVEVRLGSAIGSEPSLVLLAAARLRDQGVADGDVLLFVGRGSSEALARRQTEEVAHAVAAEVGIGHVICYTGISRPSLQEGMEPALGRRPRRVLALPYLLHTGVLVRRVSDVLSPIAQMRGAELVVLPHIGNAPALVDVVASRLERLLGTPQEISDFSGTPL